MPSFWFAVHCKPRHEKVVSEVLRGKGYEEFLPLYRGRHRSGGRFKDVFLPLFPTYLFCRLDPTHRLPVLSTPGVHSIVGAGKRPLPVDDAELEAIRRLTSSGLSLLPWPFIHAGDHVRLEEGPLRGLEGILHATSTGPRVIVSVTLLQRSVAVPVDRRWIRPLGRPSACA